MTQQDQSTGKSLVTMDEICAYVGRGKETVYKLISESGFPAVMIGGRWESNTQLIDRWRRKYIEAALEERNGVSPERVNWTA